MASALPSVPLVRMTQIQKRFAANTVLDGVNFECHGGEVHALLGANGAGKSTLIQILTGVYRPDGGQVEFAGDTVRFHHPADAVSAGISAVYQELSLVDHLDVAENVYLGREPRRRMLVDSSRMHRECAALFRRYEFDIDPYADVSSLSLARRQGVELAKALARDARVVIFDEPTAALTADEQERLFATMSGLKPQGIGIIYVSHRLEEIFRVADRVTVLRGGKVVLSAPLAELTREQIVQAMVGTKVVIERRPAALLDRSDLTPLLEITALSSQRFTDVNLTMWPGEIVVIAGLIGSGRSSLLSALIGARRVESGTVRIRGTKVDLRNVRRAIRAGVALVTEDRRRTGLAINLKVHPNVNAVALPSTIGFYNPRRAQAQARRSTAIVSFTRDVRTDARRLSGGNQQKVVIAKWLANHPKVLLCDEPTRGIDIGARAEIYEMLRELANAGVAVLVASSDLDEVLTIADRILVMAKGRIVAEFDAATATEHRLMQAATGGDITTGTE